MHYPSQKIDQNLSATRNVPKFTGRDRTASYLQFSSHFPSLDCPTSPNIPTVIFSTITVISNSQEEMTIFVSDNKV